MFSIDRHCYRYVLCFLSTGTAAAVMDSPVFGMLNKYFVKKRALANSVAFAGSGFGCLVMPLMLNYAIDCYTVRGAMFIMAGVWMHAIIIGAVLRPIRTRTLHQLPINTAQYALTVSIART